MGWDCRVACGTFKIIANQATDQVSAQPSNQ